MTRINLVSVQSLWTGHLIAEHKELPRVFQLVRAEQAKGLTLAGWVQRAPPAYVLGPGHLWFFYGRLGYLRTRYRQLCWEMFVRNQITNREDTLRWAEHLDPGWFGEYDPTPEAVILNKKRINQRLVELGHPQFVLPL